jgi:hypothetical protein
LYGDFPQKLKIQAFDNNKPFSYYYNSATDVSQKGKRVTLKFPLSPNDLMIVIYPDSYSDYNDYMRQTGGAGAGFSIKNTKIETLKTYPIWLSKEDESFILFAEKFAKNAALYSATQSNGIPSIYKSDDGRFVINYFNIITERDGTTVSTPARIGHDSGEIDIAKNAFLKYTIPGRMAILLHEYAHKYLNTKSGLDMSDEIGADINALNIYLSLGFSPYEALNVFLSVFEGANNEMNHQRYLILNDFVDKFQKGELKQYYKTETK